MAADRYMARFLKKTGMPLSLRCLFGELRLHGLEAFVRILAFGSEIEFDFRLCAGRAYRNDISSLVEELQDIG